MTYNEKYKEFDISWRTDTEHLEAAIGARVNNNNFRLNDNTDVRQFPLVLYLHENLELALNNKDQKLRVDFLEVTFAETIIHFKPIKFRRKLKAVSMQNTLLLNQFPNQKNMVQMNYKGKMHSMLFGNAKIYDTIGILEKIADN